MVDLRLQYAPAAGLVVERLTTLELVVLEILRQPHHHKEVMVVMVITHLLGPEAVEVDPQLWAQTEQAAEAETEELVLLLQYQVRL